ncbi:hypothetical protein KFL_000520240 [Klebsormidium nitens]|uniref:SH3 domain-containing protein n=1 Tax=Klebsormidium nitens TaxID=105231 RepID=A0A1Y1HRC6_KLENI|nr:hypothetical protein KFL_000520240 [Klebsormidium nitens]|eukprot:GAQ80352.1 hypothetical protein KFL_000520240 [Klebsormidium nitens]
MARSSSSKLASLVALVILACFLVAAEAYTLNDNTNIRRCGDSDNFCRPSTYCANNCCCPVIKTLPRGTNFNIYCYSNGQSINGDARWLYGKAADGTVGWLADYYVSCGGLCPASPCL